MTTLAQRISGSLGRFATGTAAITLGALLLAVSQAYAHGIPAEDQAFIGQTGGAQIFPFLYLGAQHMMTGYDHLLFLLGVIFFLYRMKDVVHYVTLFAVGHSLTLTLGVLAGINVNAYVVDAMIGLSVAYKALDNMGAFKRVLGFSPDPRKATLLFGLLHGLGLATQFQTFEMSREGLIPNILAFNVGVEVGQVLALGAILILMNLWRRYPSFRRTAFVANAVIMTAGFVLTGYQVTGFVVG